MNITLQPTTGDHTPIITHSDFHQQDSMEAFTCATLGMGENKITVFLPYMGRLNYINTKDTK